MAQTTSAVVMGPAAWVGFSTNGTTYADVSGIANAIDVSGGDLEQAETYTAGTTSAIITLGNFEPYEVTVNSVYSETTGDFWLTLQAAYQAKTALKVAWAPKGNSTGNYHYVTGSGYITSFKWPSGEMSGADPIITEFTVRAATITANTAYLA